MVKYVDTLKKMGMISFPQGRKVAREHFKDMNKILADHGIKSRVEYRLYGTGKNTLACSNIVKSKRKKR